MHAILERLSDLPAERRANAATSLIATEFPALESASRRAAQEEAEAVLEMPEADRIFGSDALPEVAVAIDDGPIRPRMIGRIDRLWIGPDHIEIIDIKTDALPPRDVENIPRAYLAQLGAYMHGLASDWPDTEIRLSLLWTAGRTLMRVPTEAAARAFTSGHSGS